MLRAAGLGVGWEDCGAAFAQADAGVVWEFAGASEDDFVAVEEEGSDFAGGERDGIRSVPGEFEKAACCGFGGAGDCSGGEDVSDLEVATITCVVGYELGRSPIEVARVAST